MNKPISISRVMQRKLKLESANVKESKAPEISRNTVCNNLTSDLLDQFIKNGRELSFDSHCKESLSLYNQLCKSKDLSKQEKDKINGDLLDAFRYVSDINSVYDKVDFSDSLDESTVVLFKNELDILENCDRVLRNEKKLNKRFDIGKVLHDNIHKGYKHTVYELCSLIDTYNIPTKAKFNIALENVQYAIFSTYPEGVTSGDIVESVLDYFLTREPVMTDKQYSDYLSVLENNKFINPKGKNISYVFETSKIFGTDHLDKFTYIASICKDKDCHDLVTTIPNIKTEKYAGNYIELAIEKILDENICKEDSVNLLKSIYLLPLIGNVNESFVNYKMEMSGKKADIKSKLTYTDNDKIIRKVLDEGKLIDMLEFVSAGVHFSTCILDESYEAPNYAALLESKDFANSDDIKDLIKQFKASKDKTPSRFKSFISRVMTKSPENIIDDTPNLFAAVRIMVYLGISAAVPLGPVFAAVLALINKVLTTNLDHKQAVKLLKHLRSEKEKVVKKIDKTSGDEKKKQEEYLACLDKCIQKVKDFISDLDDEDENLYDDNDSSSDDDFGFGDFGFNDDEFDVEGFDESATMVMNLLESVNEIVENDPIDKIFDKPLDSQILANLSVFADNCDDAVCDKFYDKLKEYKTKDFIKFNALESAKIADIVSNKGNNKIKIENEDTQCLINYEAVQQLQSIVNEGFNLNTIKLAVVNFKKKFRDLKGKEQELWRNIDIATNNLTKGFQKALTSDRREAIIKGSIIPSFSKCIKSAITVGAIGAFTGPVGAAITAMGMFAVSKRLNHRERMLIYDEIDTELTVVEKQIQLAENEGDMNQYRFLLNYQKKLIREKQRIKYGVHTSGRTIPEIKKRSDV